MDDDQVFKALADPTRRHLLDRLFERDGRTLTELESELEMTRFGVMKHLRVLEDAGLVVTRREGREKLHFLNPVPIRLIHDRWIDKYTERRVSALLDLKHETGGGDSMTTMTAQTTQVYRLFIKASSGADLGRDHEARVHARRYFFGLAGRAVGRKAPRVRAGRRASGGLGDPRGGPAAPARPRVAGLVRPRARRRGDESRHLGDRAAGGRVLLLTLVHDSSRAHRRRQRASPAAGCSSSVGLKTLLETGEPLAG